MIKGTTFNSQLIKNTKQRYAPIFIGTACTGLVRIEWVHGRYNQIIPCNWGFKSANVFIPSSAPLGYLVSEAQNIIVEKFMREDSEWLFLIEQDNIIPPDCFLRMNEYMRNKDVPIVSGLYFTKTYPAEPLVYRGRGNSFYTNWKIGDKIWCDAVPTGCLLIHRSIIEVMYKESEVYQAGNVTARRVFHEPQHVWYDPKIGWDQSSGTSDMEWCSRVIVDNVFKKAGWKKFQDMRYPFLIDSNIFVGHIDESGRVYPTNEEKENWTLDPRRRANERKKLLLR